MIYDFLTNEGDFLDSLAFFFDSILLLIETEDEICLLLILAFSWLVHDAKYLEE